MTARLHACAAEACDKQIAAHLLMCLPHWRMVPNALQRQVRRAFKAWSYAPLEGSIALRNEYRAAVRDAITAVREKEIRRALRNEQHGDNLDLPAR